MLYLDILTQDGGQMYLDIRSVEKISRGRATGILLQGVLGDGYREAQALVEFIAGEVALTCIDCSAADFSIEQAGCTDDLPGQLQNALRDELAHSGFWLDVAGMRGKEDDGLRPAQRGITG